MRHLSRAVLIACSAAALAACGSPAATSPASGAPAAPAAPAAAGEPPAAVEQVAAVTPPKARTTRAKTGTAVPAKDKWPAVDWSRVTWKLMECPSSDDLPDRTEVHAVRYADLTGDKRTEAIVAASCPTTTSTNPIEVRVFDGADRAAASPRVLMGAGSQDYLRTAEITTSGNTLTVRSDALSDRAGLCCPDLRIVQKFRWDGNDFIRISRTVTELD